MEYKPNIYPIIYWAILYGVIAAIGLFVLNLLASFITVLWFPVFLAGLVWGGFRKYKQDKAAWMASNGVTATPKSPVEEFKDAARDISDATQEMMARQAEEDRAAVMQQQVPPVAPQVPAQDVPSMPPEITPPPFTPADGEEIVSQQPETK